MNERLRKHKRTIRRDRLRAAERLAREVAALSLADGFQTMRPDLETLEGLSEIAEPTADFAELVLHGATVTIREDADAKE